jgi:hypothetical protein
MMDNIGADIDGQITIVEDVGGQAHNGKFARYNTLNGQVTVLAQHDQARFGNIGVAATAPFTNDEEFSGDIDITDIMAGSTLNTGSANDRFYLFVDQSHYTSAATNSTITTAQVEGGQILVMRAPALPSPINNARVTRSGVVRDRLTGKYKQNVTVTNTSASTLAGPFHLAIDNLTAGVTLTNISAPTANVLPLGSPSILVTAGSLGAGASATVTLEFNNASNGAINYYPRLLNGIATP